MGLDTHCDYKDSDKKEFVMKVKEWLAKNKLEPKDVDIWKYGHEYGSEEDNYSWGSCHSRILVGDISKVQGMDFPFSSMLNYDFNLYRDMDAQETLEFGKRALEFLNKALKELPKGHKIANGYTFKEDKMIPAGYMDTRESLEYAKKQALWFIMIGELGYGTIASY